jgi:hypothetical protein
MGQLIGEYRKGIIAVVGAVLPFLQGIGIELPEWLTVTKVTEFIAAVAAVLVIVVPNAPPKTTGIGTARSPAWVGVLSLLLGCMVMAGCAGTNAAYKAALEREGLERLIATSYVIGSHYTLSVAELNRLDDAGALTPQQLSRFQRIVASTSPLIQEMVDIGAVAQRAGDAETAEELQAAINEAALALAELLEALEIVNDARTSLPPDKPQAPVLALAPA